MKVMRLNFNLITFSLDLIWLGENWCWSILMGVTGISGFPSPILCYTPRWGGGGTLDFK